MNGNDVMFTAALSLLGAFIGLAIRSRLADLAYRRDGEVDQPYPGPRW